MPSTAIVRGGGSPFVSAATNVGTRTRLPFLPADVDVTRFATILGRSQAITPPATLPDTNPRSFHVEFWDVDELYNHHDDRMTADEVVTEDAYLAKRKALAARIRSTNPDVIGLAGVENLRVLEALAGEELGDLGYTIVHIDTPDPLGLDTAVLTKFPVVGEPALHVVRGTDATRGVLEATLDVGGVPLRVFVAHPKDEVRTEVARMIYHLAAEHRATEPSAEILVMGARGVPLDDALFKTSEDLAVTSGLLDNEGLRLVSGSPTTVRDHILNKTVSRHWRTRAAIERIDRDRPTTHDTVGEGKLIAPGVWLRNDVATVRHRIGDDVPKHDPAAYAMFRGPALVSELHRTLPRALVASYHDAREALFKEIANEDGWVECVYTGKRIQADGIPLSDVMNTEHTQPASLGVLDTKFLADLHHLFPTDPKANTKRSSVPFGIVKHAEWEEGGSKFGTDVSGRLVFEPRDEHKGTVARVMAYMMINGFAPEPWQQSMFVAWNEARPVDDAERRRNDLIARFQGNRNPFIDEPELMARLWST